jgi:hypothetical protein
VKIWNIGGKAHLEIHQRRQGQGNLNWETYLNDYNNAFMFSRSGYKLNLGTTMNGYINSFGYNTGLDIDIEDTMGTNNFT